MGPRGVFIAGYRALRGVPVDVGSPITPVADSAEKSPASDGSEAAADIARERRLSAHSSIGDGCAGVAEELPSSPTRGCDRFPANGAKLGPYDFDVNLGERMYVDSSVQYRNGTVTLDDQAQTARGRGIRREGR
ncbi:hypothetical protein SAMN05192544_104270 [Paraburkholderia hospita]|nr:hypothetical protein SAMN05192544_104270 [Paraburkholderia hospita]